MGSLPRAGGRALLIRRILRLYRDAFSGVPRDVWVLASTLLVNRAGTMVLPFLTLYLTQERGLSVAEAGRAMGLYGIGSVVGSYGGGWLSDRLGAVRTQQLSLVASGVGYLWLAFPREPAGIAAAVFLVSVVSEAFRPAVMAATAERAPERLQPRAFAVLRLAANLGMGVGPAVGGFLALQGYVWLFVVDGATCWLAALLLALTLAGRTPSTGSGSHDASVGPDRSPWRDGPFLALLLLVVLMAAVLFQIFSTLPVYLTEAYGLREDAIGLLLALNASLIVAFEMVLIHLVEGRSRMLLAGAGAFLLCLGFGLMPLGSSLPFIAFTIVVWTVGEMLSLPMINALVAGRAGPRRRGSYMGLYTTAYSVAFILAPLAGTWIYEEMGPDTLWLGSGLLAPVLLALAVALVRPFGPGSSRPPSGPATVPPTLE